ncbi:protein-disulfide reductase DsbD domain-containing protein [Bartonella sp. B30(2025)]
MKKIQISKNFKNISTFFHKEFLISLSIIFVFVGSFIVPVNAQTKQKSYLFATPWHESDGGRVRLAITKPSPSGIRNGIIEVVLNPGWKTYWRNPGNSGMAPFFNFNQQISYEIFYPTPQLYEEENDWSLGYTGKAVLPFSISNSKKNLSGSLTLGLCNQICIPFTVPFDFSPAALKNEYLPISILKDAQNSLPHTTHSEFRIHAEKDINTLFIKIEKNNSMTPSSLFLDGGDMQIGPAKKINNTANYTLFSAPIYFTPDETNPTIFYTIVFKNRAFSGTFVLHKQ